MNTKRAFPEENFLKKVYGIFKIRDTYHKSNKGFHKSVSIKSHDLSVCFLKENVRIAERVDRGILSNDRFAGCSAAVLLAFSE